MSSLTKTMKTEPRDGSDAVHKRKRREASTTSSITSDPNDDGDGDHDPKEENEDVWDMVWPNRNGILGSNPGECTVLLQIDPEDASMLEMEGASGAIGRLEVDGQGVILDMKGRQYQGRIFPGPTALILGTTTPGIGRVVDETENNNTQQLKVLGMTDEFVRCVQQGDALDRLSATLEQGDDAGQTSTIVAPTATSTTTTSTVKAKRSAKKAKSK
uniref:Uncharacterized protein n=1 Tax=Amphora coffeiformis TaxID=265554 RepID=A0A7S3LF37_9STRA|mmetsp:Transcript_7149/g.13668  ORF Transcript_7149/g.13668 Transcript_7149/m.13668 type:complete len:215 (-) Transcript_7149:72-716(-)